MANFSTLQANFAMIRLLITINQDFFPERMSRCYIINSPRLFRWSWRTIYPWVDVRTRDKISMLAPDDNVAQILLADIDSHVLEVAYGGTRPCPYPIPPAEDEYVPDVGHLPSQPCKNAGELEDIKDGNDTQKPRQ